jgi:hypothetical protein
VERKFNVVTGELVRRAGEGHMLGLKVFRIKAMKDFKGSLTRDIQLHFFSHLFSVSPMPLKNLLKPFQNCTKIHKDIHM